MLTKGNLSKIPLLSTRIYAPGNLKLVLTGQEKLHNNGELKCGCFRTRGLQYCLSIQLMIIG